MGRKTDEAKELAKIQQRRDFLKTGVRLAGVTLFGGTAVALAKNLLSPKESTTAVDTSSSIDSLVSQLEQQFQGIPGRHEFYPVDGARYTLVHIRQAHYSPEMEKLDLNKKLEVYHGLLQLHKDIRDTLLTLAKRGYRDVFMEGFHNEKEFSTAGTLTLDEIDSIFRNPEKQTSKEFPSLVNQLLIAITGSHIYGSKDGKYRVHPAELRDALSNGISTKDSSLVYDVRENIVLEKITTSNSANAIVLFGYSHDWRNNIVDWNSKSSNGKFNLFVINLPSVKDFAKVYTTIFNSQR